MALIQLTIKDIFNKENVGSRFRPVGTTQNKTVLREIVNKTLDEHETASIKNHSKTMLEHDEAGTRRAVLPFKETKKIAVKPVQKQKETTVVSTENVDSSNDGESEYTLEIFSHLRNMENKFSINKNFLEGHPISSRVRTILVNWLVEVHMRFELNVETLHLCVSTVDRYLQENRDIGRDTIQLLGIMSLQVACKYEESDIIELADLVYICDNTFTEHQLLKMEWELLKKLDFSFGRPSSVQFLMGYYGIAQIRTKCHSLGKFILELALLESDMSHIRPSLQAAAAFCLSVGILGNLMDLTRLWTPNLVQYTTYQYSDFENEVGILAKILVKSNTTKTHGIIKNKYANSMYDKISLNPALTGPIVMRLASKFWE